MIIGGLYVTAPEVLIARRLERDGQPVPGPNVILWRLEEIRLEIWIEAGLRGLPAREVARARAGQLAEECLAAARETKVLDVLSPQVRETTGGRNGLALAGADSGPS